MEKKRFKLTKPVIIILEVIAVIAANVISYIVLKRISDSRKSNTILLGASSPAADQSSVNWSFILPMLIPSVLMVFDRFRDLSFQVSAESGCGGAANSDASGQLVCYNYRI